ncbi:DNA-methyltransferase [Crateriforma conspicua]|uniref:DNA-methyltransferase n=1 Tax=Crateriforma TaxID=2714592 RepID=UPI0011B48989|nr:DNA methyltransferase [Crateriforma conspicua]
MSDPPLLKLANHPKRKRTVRTAGQTLIHGECVTVMRSMDDESFDVVCSDPPYCAATKGASSKSVSSAKKYTSSDAKRQFHAFEGDYRDQRSFTVWNAIWMTEAYRLVRPGGAIACFMDYRNLCCVIDAMQVAGFAYDGVVPWIKKQGRPRLGWFQTSQSEFVVVGRKGMVSRDQRRCGPKSLNESAPRQRIHPTQKPTELLKNLLSFRDDWQRILDPFAGGASTLVAASELGRHATGIELSTHYFELAAARLRSVSSAAKAA